MRRAATSDVEAEEDDPGAGGVGRAGVEDVATLAVDKLATETLGGGFGGKGMFATDVTTTSSASDGDVEDVVSPGVESSTTMPSSIFMVATILLTSFMPDMATNGK